VNPNCGLAISFKERDRDLIMAVLAEAELLPSSAYRRLGDVFENLPI
jgi:hypothetical protein